MDLFKILNDSFYLDDRTSQELIEISSLIDVEKSNNGELYGKTDDLSVMASTIVALINEKNTMDIGKKLDERIKDLIVKKNLEMVIESNGDKNYEQIKSKNSLGTYKVRKMATGYKFDIVAADGEILAVSETYSSMDSCMNGIKCVKKNSYSSIEDQTISEYKELRNPKYEIYCDREKKFRFRLKATNGQVIMVSAGYKNKKECLQVIEKIKSFLPSNDVEKD